MLTSPSANLNTSQLDRGTPIDSAISSAYGRLDDNENNFTFFPNNSDILNFSYINYFKTTHLIIALLNLNLK